VYGCRQLDGEFDRLVVVNGAELQLRHDRSSALVGFENEVVGHQHPHWKARPDGDGGLHVQ
jgi:hypothetical protein